MTNSNSNFGEKLEEVACLQHDFWIGWMNYMFSVCKQNDDGTFTIPRDKVQRWLRQMNTKYEALPEREKDSDRELSTRILSIFNSHE